MIPTQSNRKVGLSPHAYNGAPRQVGSNWRLIEKSPPDPDGWKDFNQKRAWNWKPTRKPRKSKLVDRAMRLLREMAAAGRGVGR